MADKRKQTGSSGETAACNYLIQKGYAVIDIIAEKESTLVFVEVKTLPCGNSEFLSHVLDSRKQKRIIETSKCFLAKYRQYSNDYIRFDVIAMNVPGFPDIYHIENAFTELL